MPIATHIIKIEGMFNEDWTEESLKVFVKRKIQKEIDNCWHPDLELFRIRQTNVIEIWLFIQEPALGLASNEVVSKWINDHIKEKGIIVTNFDIEKVPEFTIELNDVALNSL